MFVVSVVPASGKHNEGKQINKKKRPTEEPSLSNKWILPIKSKVESCLVKSASKTGFVATSHYNDNQLARA